jgi:hypothetical protein
VTLGDCVCEPDWVVDGVCEPLVVRDWLAVFVSDGDCVCVWLVVWVWLAVEVIDFVCVTDGDAEPVKELDCVSDGVCVPLPVSAWLGLVD